MKERPVLEKTLDRNTFREYYYLKEELVAFCRENGLPASGGKIEIADRIAHFLETGEVLPAPAVRKRASAIGKIEIDTKIEPNFVCSEKHREFFQEQIGSSFTFSVAFQKWLKNNTGKTYREAVLAYGKILAEKKKGNTAIEKQFEYNAYIHDFFADNKGRSLEEAIQCWKFKKQRPGHNRYEKSDLEAIP